MLHLWLVCDDDGRVIRNGIHSATARWYVVPVSCLKAEARAGSTATCPASKAEARAGSTATLMSSASRSGARQTMTDTSNDSLGRAPCTALSAVVLFGGRRWPGSDSCGGVRCERPSRMQRRRRDSMVAGPMLRSLINASMSAMPTVPPSSPGSLSFKIVSRLASLGNGGPP